MSITWTQRLVLLAHFSLLLSCVDLTSQFVVYEKAAMLNGLVCAGKEEHLPSLLQCLTRIKVYTALLSCDVHVYTNVCGRMYVVWQI